MLSKTLKIEVLKELSEFMTVEQLVNHISFIAKTAYEGQIDDKGLENASSDDMY